MKWAIILLITIIHPPLDAKTILATGAIESENTQHVLMPLVETFNGKVNELVAEGSKVKTGDWVAKIDGSSVDTKIENLKEQLDTLKETIKKSEIDSSIALSNSQIAYQKAEISLKIAKMKAQLPLNYIGELKYKQNQLSYKQSQKAFEKASNDLTEAQQKKEEKQKENHLALQQKQKKLKTQQQQLKNLSIYAKQDGYVVYSQHPWTGKKIQAGDQLQTGMEILTISQNKNLQIIAWFNAIDVPNIHVGQKVDISFDAYLSKKYAGEIIAISQGGEEKKIWGNGLYYKVTIKMLEKPHVNLLIGMSALIEIKEQEND